MNIWSLLDGQRPLPHTVRQAPVLNQRVTIYLGAGESKRIEVASQYFCSLIVQAITGVLDVYLSDNSNGLAMMPDFRFQSGTGPQQVYFHSSDYYLSVHNPLSVQS